MKKIYSCLIILTFFASCANDGIMGKETSATANNKGDGTILPAYTANAYDNSGRVYDEIFDAYYDGTVRSKELSSVIGEVETIANSIPSFSQINDSGYEPISAERVQYLSQRTISDIPTIVGVSDLSANAKTSFSNFLISITAFYYSEADALKMYNEVVKYEEKVINSELLTPNDKRLILTSTSIIRYSSYRAKKKPKKNTDPYWTIWVTHIFGAEEGAEENEAKAIIEGLVTGIVSNK